MKKASSISILLILLLFCTQLAGQDQTYYPNGDPDKWNVQVTPFLWLPSMSGEMESYYLSQDFKMAGIDIVSNLKMAFMINAEVSKGKVFVTPSYVYAKIGTDKVAATFPTGDELTISPEITMNIAGLNVGLHEVVSEKLIIDPYLGLRYNSFLTALEVQGLLKTTNVQEEAVFTDPLLGLRILYFPHPRVPIMFRSDVGGFGIGSDISWTAVLDAGYTLSPQVDLIAGFSAYGMNFTGDGKAGNTAGLDLIMYGLNLGAKIMFPRRAKDPEVFKKFR
jgi:hypothetical protein